MVKSLKICKVSTLVVEAFKVLSVAKVQLPVIVSSAVLSSRFWLAIPAMVPLTSVKVIVSTPVRLLSPMAILPAMVPPLRAR